MQRARFLLVLLAAASCVADPASDEVGSSSAALTPVTWTDVVGASAAGNDLTKTAPETVWNAGAVSVETLSGDGFVEFTTGETTTTKLAGLSNGNGGQGLADIDFAIRLGDGGGVTIYEAGVNRGDVGTYVAGDLFKVQVNGDVVTYWRNGAHLYTSGLAASFPLLVDTSLRTPGGTITDVALQSTAFWDEVVGAVATGNDLRKTAAETTWNAGAVSIQELIGDGFVRFTTGETTTAKIAGLSSGNTSQSLADIDFGILLTATGRVNVYEAGTHVGSFGSYVDGDVFRVQVLRGVVTYWRNDDLLYTSAAAPPGFPLLVDTALRTPGATIEDVALGSLNIWTSPLRVTIDGRDITKTAPEEQWNAGAVSVDSIEEGDGYAEFRGGDATSEVVAGLSRGNGNAGRNEIDFGIQLGATGLFGVIENGTFIRNFGTYTASDTFQVQVSGGVVTYFKDRLDFYTSTAVPSFPLLLDSSIRTPGASIVGARVVPGESATCELFEERLSDGAIFALSELDAAGDVMVWLEYDVTLGGARVYRRSPGGWSLEQTIRRDDWNPTMWGHVSTDGHTIAIAAGPRFDRRFVVVYRHDGTQWNEEALLPGCADDPGGLTAVAVQGDVLVAGAPSASPATPGGRLYVHRRDASGSWPLEAVLTHANAEQGDVLGVLVAIGGERIFAGAQGVGNDGGIVVFRYNAGLADPPAPPSCSNLDRGKWREKWTLLAPPEHRYVSGEIDVNRDGSRLVAGDPVYLHGDAHLFQLDSGAWTETTIVPYRLDQFGRKVALGGDGPNRDSLLAIEGDAVYLFERVVDGGYTQIANVWGGYGEVALSGDTLFADGPGDDEDAVDVFGVNPTCVLE